MSRQSRLDGLVEPIVEPLAERQRGRFDKLAAVCRADQLGQPIAGRLLRAAKRDPLLLSLGPPRDRIGDVPEIEDQRPSAGRPFLQTSRMLPPSEPRQLIAPASGPLAGHAGGQVYTSLTSASQRTSNSGSASTPGHSPTAS